MTVSKYTLYNAVGEPVALIMATEEELPAVIEANAPGSRAIRGNYDWDNFKFVNDAPVEYSPAAKARRLARPGHRARWDVATEDWVDIRTALEKVTDNKAKVRQLLADSDWVVLRAQEENSPVPLAWRQYRKALRDLDPADPVWPTPPAQS